MKKHYCSYELSHLARKSGFDEECFQVYENENKLRHLGSEFNNTELVAEGYTHWISAPELTHLQQWVWEKFNVWVSTKIDIDNGSPFINIFHTDIKGYVFDCPYKALESGLLEFFKNKQQ